MVMCKYFLQGTCRFGDSCKFEHQVNTDHSYVNSTSILLQNYGNKPAQTTTNVDTSTLVKSVVNDMTSAEKGGQWLLSSYAPFKEKPAFPGFEDHSMEEIRYLFYESVKNGTLDQFKQNLQLILQQAVMKIKMLQTPSPDVVNLLKSIYNTPPSSSFNSNQTPFNSNTPTNSMFGGPQPPQNSIFGNPPPNQTVFSQTNSPSNVFAPNQATQPNIFRGTPSNPIFGGGGGGGQTNSVFASPSKSIFGNSQQTPNSAVFGGNPIFGGGTPGTPPVFANQSVPPFAQSGRYNQQQAQQMAFATAQQNIFHQNANNQFGQQVPTNGNQFPTPQQPSLVGENKPSIQHSSNIFGNLVAAPSQSVFGGGPTQSKPDPDFYSKPEELNEEEIRWFQSDDLDVNKIPEKPPTYEMCFKT